MVQSVWDEIEARHFRSPAKLARHGRVSEIQHREASEDRIAHIELLANQDAEFEQYMYLRELANGRLANTERRSEHWKRCWRPRMAKPVRTARRIRTQCADREVVLRKRLTAEIKTDSKDQREDGQVRGNLNRHVNFGARVQQDTAAWAERRANEKVLGALDSFRPHAEQSIDVLPDDGSRFSANTEGRATSADEKDRKTMKKTGTSR